MKVYIKLEMIIFLVTYIGVWRAMLDKSVPNLWQVQQIQQVSQQVLWQVQRQVPAATPAPAVKFGTLLFSTARHTNKN